MSNFDWKEKKDGLERSFEFENFKEALAFVNRIGDLAESKQHHPDIFIYDYKNVRLNLFTHDEGKVTEKDFSMAKEIDQIKKLQ